MKSVTEISQSVFSWRKSMEGQFDTETGRVINIDTDLISLGLTPQL
jgi:hypothetical protein